MTPDDWGNIAFICFIILVAVTFLCGPGRDRWRW